MEQRRGDDDLLSFDARPLLRRGAGRPDVAAMRQRHALRQAGRTRRVEDHGDFFRRHVDRLEPATGRITIEQAVELLHRDGRHQRADQCRALGVGDRELDGRVLHDVRHRLARQLVIDADRDQSGRHGGHVEDQIVGAVGRHDRHGLASGKPALQQAPCQGCDALAAFAIAQPDLFVALGRELDDEGPVVRRLRVENGSEILEGPGSLSAQRPAFLQATRACK